MTKQQELERDLDLVLQAEMAWAEEITRALAETNPGLEQPLMAGLSTYRAELDRFRSKWTPESV